MANTHADAPMAYGRAFALGIALNIGFVLIEFIFGRIAHSLALVADAGHNLSDVLGLLLAWGAAALARRQPSERRTYGMRRATVLAALLNAVVLLIAIGAIAWEAIRRFGEPAPIAGMTVIVVAAIGIGINAVTAFMFRAGQKDDLNIKGAFLHMAADAGVSLGVVIAGIAILATNWLWLDPVMSLIIVTVIFAGTWGLLKDSVNLALDTVPEGIDVTRVQAYLAALPAVTAVHDLHIWAMSTTETALTAHLVMARSDEHSSVLARATRELTDQFSIEHVTLQIESSDAAFSCPVAPTTIV